MWLSVALALLVVARSGNRSSGPLPHEVYVWQRTWNAPVCDQLTGLGHWLLLWRVASAVRCWQVPVFAVNHPKLILFDIDGTLITSGGAGERALRLALREEFSIEDDLKTIEIAGRTDSGIVRQICRKFRLEETPENFTKFLDGYLHRLQDLLPKIQGRLLPGILPLLDALKAREDIVLGLLTGNVERGAELKLRHYGVWHYFEFGAYADDHHDRNELGKFACSRALERKGIEFPPERIYVLGDTPHDITCARAFGAKAIAIATGNFSRAQLSEYAPDFLFDDLSDLNAVLAVFR